MTTKPLAPDTAVSITQFYHGLAGREEAVARLRQEIAQLQDGINRMDAAPVNPVRVYDGGESSDELDV